MEERQSGNNRRLSHHIKDIQRYTNIPAKFCSLQFTLELAQTEIKVQAGAGVSDCWNCTRSLLAN